MKDHRDIVRYSDTVELIRHELSTPVATALLYIGIAESCVSRLPGDVVMPALRVVRSEVQRLKALIDTMTELQRAGRPTLRPRFMEIGATVRSAAKRLLTTFAGTEGVSIVLPSHGVYGWWDQTAVEQIVTNLLTNALKFGQGGSVRVVVGGTASAGIRIAVTDRGIGISPAERERIFERHEHAPADQGGGIGLGLWLVRELALAHGGRVTVRSRKGHGSTFTVLLRTQPPVLGATPPAQVLPRLPAQRSPVRTVSNEPASRGPIPTYWQDRLARSQAKTAVLARGEVAPNSTMVSPALTANLKSKWPSRNRKSIPGRSLNRSRGFVAPTLRGSGT